MISIKALATLIPLIAFANGHMLMKTPIPYGKGTISNGPLDASGSDFPCKKIFTLANGDADINKMTIGQPQTLSFTGSAVHGGGSCQVSLTTDLEPTKDSKWMVIKSIEGSCPAGVDGNLAADPNGSGASEFQYTIPDGVAPGQYTIAWTWVNKIGNREFYMNCGRADIAAPAKKRYAPAYKVSKRQANFPGLFVANLASINQCATTEGTDIKYPNPGPDPIVSTNANVKFGPPTGTNCEIGGGAGGAPAPVGSSGAGSSSAAASASSAAPGVFASGAASSSAAAPTGFATGAASSSAAASATTSAAAAPAATTSASSGGASGAAGSTPAISGSQTPNTACSPEGQWSCAADGTSFQRCASGLWSAVIPVAAGTKCVPGESNAIQMAATGAGARRFAA